MTKHELHRDYTRVYRDVYVPATTPMTARLRAEAAAVFAGPDAVLVGLSAAAIYSTKWLDPDAPAEVARGDHFRPPKAMLARRYALAPDEVFVRRDGIKVTTPARTGFDLGRRLPRCDAVVMLDALCKATLIEPSHIQAVAERHPRAAGVGRLREILKVVDAGADSPPESLTRLTLIDAGLPCPETQLVVIDAGGGFIARCDMGWRRWKVVVEYEGEQHWDRKQRAADIERYALLEELGWVVIRVGADLLNRHPAELVDRVRRKLRAAGAPV